MGRKQREIDALKAQIAEEREYAERRVEALTREREQQNLDIQRAMSRALNAEGRVATLETEGAQKTATIQNANQQLREARQELSAALDTIKLRIPAGEHTARQLEFMAAHTLMHGGNMEPGDVLKTCVENLWTGWWKHFHPDLRNAWHGLTIGLDDVLDAIEDGRYDDCPPTCEERATTDPNRYVGPRVWFLIVTPDGARTAVQ